MRKTKENKAITLVALVITIIILLLLAGIAIANLGGENGIFEKVKQSKKAQIESEMKEQLTIALQELQVEKNGSATLDDVTQEWATSIISSEYNLELKEDSSFNGKLIIMNKNNIKGKFMIDQSLNISSTEYNTSSIELEYTTISRTDNKVKINIVVTDNINGIKQIDYPEGNPLKVVSGVEKKISIDYEVELGKEYKFVIKTGDGNKTEKIIKIDDYFYNVTKNLGEGSRIDNNATKTAYNKSYEATISTTENYAIISLSVTMNGKEITTSGSDVVDVNTGKIKIDKVTGNINITVTTKKLEIHYTAVAVSTSNSASNISSLEANTQNRGTTLYINIIAKLEGNNCTVVLKSDNSKTVPYAVTTNGRYTFIVSGTYNGKIIAEEKEVIVNQYMSAQGVVQYDAGDWTEEEIQELKSKNLYNINKEKIANTTTGLDFTFGGFTYKGDTANADDIKSGNIITSRNQSVTPQSGWGTPKYSGWQILESKEENGKTYVTKITHAGSPENFAYCYTGTYYDNMRVEYILSGGKRQTYFNTYQPRSWQMYVDQRQKDLIADTIDNDGNQIKDIHAMDYSEASSITGTNNGIRSTGVWYWLASAGSSSSFVWFVYNNGNVDNYGNNHCWGVRPVVSLTSGIYIKTGTGTEADPYILGKGE